MNVLKKLFGSQDSVPKASEARLNPSVAAVSLASSEDVNIEEFPFGPPCCNSIKPVQLVFKKDNKLASIHYSCSECRAELLAKRWTWSGAVVWIRSYPTGNTLFECKAKACKKCGKDRCLYEGILFHERGPKFEYCKCHSPSVEPATFDFPFGPPCCDSREPVRISTDDGDWRFEFDKLIKPYLCPNCKSERWSIEWRIGGSSLDELRKVSGAPSWDRDNEITTGLGRTYSYWHICDCGCCGKKSSAYEWDMNMGESEHHVQCKNCGRKYQSC